MLKDDSQLFTAAEAGRELGINPHRVHCWHHRDRIVPFGTDERGFPRFHIADLRRLNRRALEDPRTFRVAYA